MYVICVNADGVPGLLLGPYEQDEAQEMLHEQFHRMKHNHPLGVDEEGNPLTEEKAIEYMKMDMEFQFQDDAGVYIITSGCLLTKEEN